MRLRHPPSHMLYDYSPDDAAGLAALKTPGAHKWNGLVELYQTGLPTTNAMLIGHPANLREDLERFHYEAVKSGVSMVTVRHDGVGPDGKCRNSGVSRGADRFDEIEADLRRGISDGFTCTLQGYAEHRSMSDACVSVAFTASNRFTAEMLGPGHDAGMLTKGKTQPALRLNVELPTSTRRCTHVDIWDETRELAPKELRDVRMKRIGDRLRFLAETHGRSIPAEWAALRELGPVRFMDEDLLFNTADEKEIIYHAMVWKNFVTKEGRAVEETAFCMNKSRTGQWFASSTWDKNYFGDLEYYASRAKSMKWLRPLWLRREVGK